MADREFVVQTEPEEALADRNGQHDQGVLPHLVWDPSVKEVPLAIGWDSEPCVVDWEGNGRADLLISSGGGEDERTVRLYRAIAPSGPGLPPIYEAGRSIPELKGLRCIGVIPNGKEGRFDLVALAPEGLVHLPNHGTEREPKFDTRRSLGLGPDLGISDAQIIQIFPIDWDQDGRTDLLVGLHDLTGYWPDGDLLPTTQQVGLNQKAAHPGYDRQGLWRGRAPIPRIVWLRNVGSMDEPRFDLQPEITGDAGPLDLGLYPAPLAVSWGGRGSLELLTSDQRGLLRVYRNFGGQLPPVLMEPRTLHCAGAPVLLPDDRVSLTAGDLDQDGRTELLFGTSTGSIFAVHAGPSRNEARNPVPLLHQADEVLLGGHSSMIAADVDGDGDLDIVYGDSAGRIHYLQDLGQDDDHRYALPITLEAGGAPFRLEPGADGMLAGPAGHKLGFAQVALADWMEHDRPDLIVSGSGGDVLLLPNDGARNDPRFGHPEVIRCEGVPLIIPPRVRPAVASFDDPESLDLIALDLQGFLCVFPRIDRHAVDVPIPLRDRLGRFIRLDGSFALGGGCALWAGHWSVPDRVDLLVGLPRYNRHVVPALTGVPLRDVESLPTVLLLENVGGGIMVPRPLRYRDGRPVIVGQDGCYPQGALRRGHELPDLLVGSDDGRIVRIARDRLCW
jgi:hypothetical protein